MIIALLAQPISLFMGLFLGFCIGFLLEKAQLSDFNVIVGQFLLHNFQMLKVLAIAIVTVSILLYSFDTLGYMAIPVNTITPMRALVGGSILGAGMAILGYCPASALAAIGQGARDAIWGIIGMVTGGMLLEVMFPWFIGLFSGEERPLFFAQYWGVSPWVLIFSLFFGVAVLFGILKRYGK